MAILEPEYIIMVSNVNRCKERDRCRRLENKFLKVFVTGEEDNMQDIYIQENGRKLGWLAKQADCVGMGRQEALALIYRASVIGNGEAVKNVKAILAY